MTNKQGQIPAKTLRKGYVALGSNLETATRTSLDFVNEALGLFLDAKIRISQQSQWYSAPAFPKGNGPDYVNGVVEIETDLKAEDLLTVLHDIEKSLGRTRLVRWEARVVDLDLLALGSEIAPSKDRFDYWKDLPLKVQLQDAPDELILPHPRMHERAFVLKPLAQIAPDWVHPVLGQSASTILAALPVKSRDEIRPL